MQFNESELRKITKKLFDYENLPGGVTSHLGRLNELLVQEDTLEKKEILGKIKDGLMGIVAHTMKEPVTADEFQQCGDICHICAQIQWYLKEWGTRHPLPKAS